MLSILNTHIDPWERPQSQPLDGNIRGGETPKTIIRRNIRTPDGMFRSPDIYNRARGIYNRAKRWERKRPVTIFERS